MCSSCTNVFLCSLNADYYNDNLNKLSLLRVQNFPKEGKIGVFQIHVIIQKCTITNKYEIEPYGHNYTLNPTPHNMNKIYI